MRSKCWRARISVGAISAAWRPASTALAMASSATTVLPEPTSPCSRRSMRLSEARSRRISASARACAPVSPKGRAAVIFARDPAVAGVAARPAAAASGCARGRARAARPGARHRRGAGAPGSRRRPRARRRRRQPGDEAGAAPRRRRGSGSVRERPRSCHSGSAGTRSSAAPTNLPTSRVESPSVSPYTASTAGSSPMRRSSRMRSGWTIWR